MSGCYNWNGGDPVPYYYPAITAITISKDSLKKSVHTSAPSDIHQAGKIYVYKNYLLVVEPLSGIHIFDNSDPHNPTNINFISAPGCGDIAVKENALYVDNAIDLVTVDITDPRSPKVTARIEDVFPSLPIPTDRYYYNILDNPDPTKYVIIGWKDTTVSYR